MGYLIFALRLGIGGLLIVTGVLKALDGPSATVASVAGYQLLPHVLVAPFGVVLPYLEIFVGLYLVAGLFTKVAAGIAAALFAAFAIAVAWATARGLTVNCGCFGGGRVEHPTWLHVAGDSLLVVASLVILWYAPGAFAADTKLGVRPQTPSPRGSTAQ